MFYTLFHNLRYVGLYTVKNIVGLT